MEKIKTILDREPLSSDYIASKQDFANVLDGAKGLGKPYWKSNWFVGTVGVTAVAIIVTAVTLTNSETPVKNTNSPMATVAVTGDTQEEKVTSQEETNPTEQITDATLHTEAQETVEVPTQTQSEDVVEPEARIQVQPENTPTPAVAQNARQKPEVVKAKSVEIGLPNLAGVTEGKISFRDFCDPLGIQVGNGILIHQYTLQYRSCAREMTVRIRGNLLPRELCAEIADCGGAVEVNFSNFLAEDRNGNAVQLKPFSLVTSPKF